MELRLTGKEDIGRIVEITKNDGFHKPLDPLEIEKSINQGDRYFLVCDPEPVGLVKLVVNKDGFDELALFSIITSFQGKGIGSEILKCVEKKASESGKTKLYARCRLKNEKALRFYGKNGFERAGTIEGSDGKVARLVKKLS